MKKALSYLLLIVLAVGVGIGFYLPHLDRYQVDGELQIAGISAPVTVRRDVLGVPYIHADTLSDALVAQGFVTAQDRLFQMELFRALSYGELAALIGEKGLRNDRLVRILDLPGLSRRQAAAASGMPADCLG